MPCDICSSQNNLMSMRFQDDTSYKLCQSCIKIIDETILSYMDITKNKKSDVEIEMKRVIRSLQSQFKDKCLTFKPRR
jgi:hypothetical protein